MRSPFKLGMSVAEARAIAADLVVNTYGDPYLGVDDTYVEAVIDGWEHHVHFEDDVADQVWARCEVATLAEVLELVGEVVTQRGAPALAGPYTLEGVHWRWPASSFTLSITPKASMWEARWDLAVDRFDWSKMPRLELAVARASAEAVARSLATVAPSTDIRGRAVERWKATLTASHARLDHFLDVLGIATPTTSVQASWIPDLVEQAGWLSEHAERFPEIDDWRDAIVFREIEGLIGWEIDYAYEGLGEASNRDPDDDRRFKRPVRLIRAPFATGILRVQLGVPADEIFPLHAIPEDIEVTITKPTYRQDRFEKMKSDRARAVWRDIVVEIEGGSRLEQVARALVAVRGG